MIDLISESRREGQLFPTTAKAHSPEMWADTQSLYQNQTPVTRKTGAA
jgi:hypothetical protein